MRASLAIKECRTDINMAEENMIEMLLRGSEDTYGNYRSAIEENINKIASELEIIEKSGIVSDELYKQFEDTLLGWGTAGFQVVGEIEAGNKETAARIVFEKCVPILEEVELIVDEIDDVTAQEQKASTLRTMIATIAGIVGIVITIISIVVTTISIIQTAKENKKTSKKQPLRPKLGCSFDSTI